MKILIVLSRYFKRIQQGTYNKNRKNEKSNGMEPNFEDRDTCPSYTFTYGQHITVDSSSWLLLRPYDTVLAPRLAITSSSGK